eukprot:GEMP01131369.1.p2 GENE.GEMP01131369.1~~GEMP01131369.1.p2  ORF type:complete len:139 (+),score=12.76 GEMP01131369.1:33-449(+)
MASGQAKRLWPVKVVYVLTTSANAYKDKILCTGELMLWARGSEFMNVKANVNFICRCEGECRCPHEPDRGCAWDRECKCDRESECGGEYECKMLSVCGNTSANTKVNVNPDANANVNVNDDVNANVRKFDCECERKCE